MKLVFSTNNPNKLEEVKSLIPKNIELLSLDNIDCKEKIAETADTLHGNAKIKADYISVKYGYDCFADDTGLEVEALDGLPGVYSARYAGEPSNSKKNIQKLLKEMENAPNRNAQFKTSICLVIYQNNYFFEGICKGTILNDPIGDLGFGYDSIFSPEGTGKSFAEMASSEKNKISHRALAIGQLIRFLEKI